MERGFVYENELNLKETELKLGLPGRDDKGKEEEEEDRVSCPRITKRLLSDPDDEPEASHAVKAQIVGWPPVRSYRKNLAEGPGIFVKVSMDGAPYLRKIDLKVYKGYPELLKALESMFKCTVGGYSEREGYKGSDFVPTYEDKDNDWMLLGDVPWGMFMSSCKRLRIMKGSEAKKGLGCGV